MIEMTYLGSLLMNLIPRWLLHNNIFSKIMIEEGIGHIVLIKRPPLICCQRENNTYLVKVDHKGEGILILNSIGLGKTHKQLDELCVNESFRKDCT